MSLLKLVFVLLAITGLGAATTVTLLVTGVIGAEEITRFVSWTQEARAWIAGISAGSVLTWLGRYALPAFLQYRRESRENLIQQIRNAVVDDINRR
ncbi:hypothetical protein HY213_03690 [Candidatus Peregrinibacteria bacterium]|nr:hypothetical protein [Candidatus Peregrinibacteria bacterium]